MSYKFETTVELQGLRELFSLSGTEWSKPLSADEFALLEAKKTVDRILAGRPARGFLLRSKQSGQIAASCLVAQNKALYKDPSLSSIGNTPDPVLFGVKNATALLISYVFVSPDHRKQGLMQDIVNRAIKYTEKEILDKELARSSDSKDSFKHMVQSGRDIDMRLANHYLGKKYFWYLYSAIGEAYAKLGFKGYPLEGYKIGFGLSQRESSKLVQALLKEGTIGGKTLHLLDGSVQKDHDTIAQIKNGEELELLTELNKNLFHSELSGSRRSSLSLSNIQHALHSKVGSKTSLSGGHVGPEAEISAKLDSTHIYKNSFTGDLVNEVAGRRTLSVLQFSTGKFALVPSKESLETCFSSTKEVAKRCGSEANQNVADIRGAIVTNEMQHRSFYILWKQLKQKDFHIVGMGELSLDVFPGLGSARRKSSFTGINEMGGYNFQDWELLLAVAVHIARQETVNDTEAVYVALNDLPTEVPVPVMHDFFMNYWELPSDVVSFVPDFSAYGILPMIRRYGSADPHFELDWVANSLAAWG